MFMQSPYFLILAFVLILLLYPVPIGVKVDYSLDNNAGKFVFKIFNKEIKLLSFQFEKFGIAIFTKKSKKFIAFEFEVNKRKLVYFENLFFQFKDKIKIKYMAFNSKIGTLDAFKTAMIIGVLNQLFYSFFSYMKNDKQTATLIVDGKPEWEKKVFEISICFNLTVSIFEILYCLLFANLKARMVK